MNLRGSGSFTLAVAAGKGGTGKTLLAASLAQALAREGREPVQLLDCDVEEPNAALLLNPSARHQRPVTVPVPRILETRCAACGKCAAACQFSALALMRRKLVLFSALCIGCGACAYVCPEGAIVEEERVVGTVTLGEADSGLDFVEGRANVGEQRVTPVLKALKKAMAPRGVRILDAPPGTACPMQETVSGADFCLLVTEPTPFGRSDLAAAVETCRALEVPCAVVVNRAGVGDRGVYEFCAAEGLPLLLEIPWQRAIAAAYARGETLLGAGGGWKEPLLKLFQTIKTLAERR